MKDFFLTDIEIQDLINEPKRISESVYSLMRSMKPKRGRNPHIMGNSCKFPRQNGKGEWLLYIRLNSKNHLDFSCGLKFIPERSIPEFTLRRYNGKNHPHTNLLEKGKTFRDFHIHTATEKYQNSKYSEEHYAEPTDRYGELKEALECLFKDCKIEEEIEAQKEMF